MNRRRVKRWRLSDVARVLFTRAGFGMMLSREGGRNIGRDATQHGIANTMRIWNVTFSHLLGIPTERWDAMSDADREAAVVAEARRLKVPRRA